MKRILLSPDAGEAGASGNEQTTTTAEANATANEDILAGAEQGGTEAAGAGGEGTEPVPAGTVAGAGGAAATSGLSKDDIREILSSAMERVGGQPTTAAPSTEPTMTAEDFEKAFNVFKATPELLAQLRHEDPAIATKAFHALRDGLIRQAMTMAEYRMKQYIDNLRTNDLAPLQTYVSEAQATSFRNDFFSQYPDLEKYETIVDAVASKLGASGFTAPTRDGVMKRFAEETQQIVSQLTATQGAGGNGGATKTGTTTGRKMSTLTGGGQTGGQRTAPEPKGPRGIEVFD